MFIRKTRKKAPVTNKEYFIFQLVESYRTERGPRQRILLNLGSNLSLSDSDRKSLANRIEELLAGSVQTLLSYPPQVEQLAEKYVTQLLRKSPAATQSKDKRTTEDIRSIDLDTLEHEYCRSVGVEHIAYETLRKLEIEKKLFEQGLSRRQVEIAIGVIVARLVKPNSELATHRWLQTQSGIDELIETDFSQLGLRSVYQAGDNLLKHKDALEAHLRERERDLFGLEDTIVLYDLTNTYFEGTAQSIEKAARGRSKEKRSDCPLVTLGLVLDKQGFPLRSEVLPGNISEPRTLEKALDHLNGNPHRKPIVVFDAGIASEENLLYLKENGYRYIVAAKHRSVEVPSDLQLDVVKEINDNCVRVGQVKNEITDETILYCHSTQRQQKEESMRSLLQKRFEEDLKRASDALNKKGGTKSYSKVMERIGRLKERHKRVASYYAIEVLQDGSKAKSITWSPKEEKLDKRFQGAYCLRTFGLDWTCAELWRTYVMLTQVEEAFRCLKTDLGLRPIFHRIDRRVEAHLFITVLAYHMMQTVLHKLRLAGMPIRWSTLCNRMATQVRVTSSMRLQTGKQVRIRTTTRPEPHQKQIYTALDMPAKPGKRIKIYT